MMNLKEMGFKMHRFRDNIRERGQKKEWKVNGLLLPSHEIDPVLPRTRLEQLVRL